MREWKRGSAGALTVFRLRRHPEEPIIGVFDCSFLPKSGTKTWGIDRFFSSLAGRSKKGLSAEVLGIVATGSHRAFGVDATQTPPGLSKSGADGYSRVDFYLEQIIDLYDRLAGLGVSYWVTGGFYAKQKVFDTVTNLEGDLITRLRSDANLRYYERQLLTGTPKDGPGRPKQVKDRAEEAGFDPSRVCCHTFRGTGITAYLENGGKLEVA